jgi:hypothetical protein
LLPAVYVLCPWYLIQADPFLVCLHRNDQTHGLPRRNGSPNLLLPPRETTLRLQCLIRQHFEFSGCSPLDLLQL